MRCKNVHAVVTALVLSFSLLATAGSAEAQILNGGFESDEILSGWMKTGVAGVTGGSFPGGLEAAEGTYAAILTTDSSDDPNPVSAAEIESFLGLAADTLSGAGFGAAIEGSAIKQTFAARAGDQLSFEWDLYSDELDEPIGNNDFAFVTLSPTVAPFLPLADTVTSPFFFAGPFPFDGHTGFFETSFLIPTDGSYTLGFGIVDVGDEAVMSALLVDRVMLHTPRAPEASAVPEPATLALMGLGVPGLLAAQRKRRSARAS
jgi:hypothetical protein